MGLRTDYWRTIFRRARADTLRSVRDHAGPLWFVGLVAIAGIITVYIMGSPGAWLDDLWNLIGVLGFVCACAVLWLVLELVTVPARRDTAQRQEIFRLREAVRAALAAADDRLSAALRGVQTAVRAAADNPEQLQQQIAELDEVLTRNSELRKTLAPRTDAEFATFKARYDAWVDAASEFVRKVFGHKAVIHFRGYGLMTMHSTHGAVGVIVPAGHSGLVDRLADYHDYLSREKADLLDKLEMAKRWSA
jgi:hypothetical protein